MSEIALLYHKCIALPRVFLVENYSYWNIDSWTKGWGNLKWTKKGWKNLDGLIIGFILICSGLSLSFFSRHSIFFWPDLFRCLPQSFIPSLLFSSLSTSLLFSSFIFPFNLISGSLFSDLSVCSYIICSVMFLIILVYFCKNARFWLHLLVAQSQVAAILILETNILQLCLITRRQYRLWFTNT